MLFLGLDIGTQSTKCLVYSLSKRCVVGRGAASYDVISTRQGQAEQHPHQWIEAAKTAIKAALRQCDKGNGDDVSVVRGISVGGQQHGLVVLDKNRDVIRPAKLWCDLESADEAEQLSVKFNDPSIVASFTCSKLLWLRRHEPENFERVAHVMLPHDYVNFWLTGEITMEVSDASGTGLLDPVTHQWRKDRMDAIDERLIDWVPPDLLKPDQPAGILQSQVATALGLRTDVEIVVGPGGGDNAMSAIGIGAVDPGVMILSLGTSGTLFGPAPNPVEDPNGLICPFSDVLGQGLPLLCTINCTTVVNEVQELCNLSHDDLASLALIEPPGCHGMFMLPYFSGERTPNWPHASGTLLGIRPGLLKPSLLYRAALEATTFSLLLGLETLKKLTSIKPKELRIVGGGSKNRAWRQIIADSFQLPLRFPKEIETVAFGAALQAASVSLNTPLRTLIKDHSPPMEEDLLQPDRKVAQAYLSAFQKFKEAGHFLFQNQ